jgi:hypothetical protein
MSANGEVVRKDISDEEAWRFRTSRRECDAKVTAYRPKEPLAHVEASEIYSRLFKAERKVVPNGDYETGSARIPDDILTLHGLSRVLLTAEHATQHFRLEKSTGTKQPKIGEPGTAALSEIIAQDTNSTAIIAIGRQTGDANNDPKHILRDAMTEVINDPSNLAHLSFHLLFSGRASQLKDTRGYSAILGLGDKPSEATKALADFLIETGNDLDLRVGVNANHFNFYENTHRLVLNKDGTVRQVSYAARGPYTTRAHSQAVASALGKNDEYVSMQIEINEALLVSLDDETVHPTQLDRELGAYLGYLFTRRAVESILKL